MKLELKDVLDDVSVRLGKDRPLIPMSKLMVLPGQVWRSKTELVRNAQNKPQENARRIVEDSVAIFGWTTAGQIENFVSSPPRVDVKDADFLTRSDRLV